MSEAGKKNQAKVLGLGMVGAAAVGLYWWWKNRQGQGIAGQLIPEQPLIFPEGGGGGTFPEFFIEIPPFPAFPEIPPYPTPENGGNGQPTYIFSGGGGVSPAPAPAPPPTPISYDTGVGFGTAKSPDIGVVKYAVYPSDLLDPNKLDPISRVVYESGRQTGFWLKNLGKLATPSPATFASFNPFNWFKIPTVQASGQYQETATQQFPTPLPSVTTPEGFMSTPTPAPTELGFMPSWLKPSWMKTAAQQPATTKPVATTAAVTQQWTAYDKPKWLGG